MIQRIEKLQKRLASEGMDGALLWYSRDILYYTGTAQPSRLAVLPHDYRLFVQGGYERAMKDVRIDPSRVEEQRDLKSVFGFLRDMGVPETGVVGTELDVLPVTVWDTWKKAAPGWTFVNVSPAVLDQRQIKEPVEIEAIRRAHQVVHQGHLRIKETLREGISELEFSAELEDAHRRAGHEGMYFMRHPDFFMGRGLMATGPNLLDNTGVAFSVTGVGLSAAVPAGASRRIIRTGDLVLVDIPVMADGYHVDHTRTYVVGRANAEQQRLQQALERLFDYAGDILRPGKTWGECFQAVAAHAEKLGVRDVFQNMQRGRRLHYIGHGVGLELNEPPLVTAKNGDPVLAGTVLALEMHMLLDGRMALKMEDMLLIGEDANEFLSITPRKLFEVP